MREHKIISGYFGGVRLAMEDSKLHEHPNLDRELDKFYQRGWKIEHIRPVPMDTQGFWVLFHLVREAPD